MKRGWGGAGVLVLEWVFQFDLGCLIWGNLNSLHSYALPPFPKKFEVQTGPPLGLPWGRTGQGQRGS